MLFETIMLICFGLSWPVSVIKSWKTRSAKGKSLLFSLVILAGYAAGIAGKFISGSVNYVLAVYILNVIMVMTDIGLYFRNKHLDKLAQAV